MFGGGWFWIFDVVAGWIMTSNSCARVWGFVMRLSLTMRTSSSARRTWKIQGWVFFLFIVYDNCFFFSSSITLYILQSDLKEGNVMFTNRRKSFECYAEFVRAIANNSPYKRMKIVVSIGGQCRKTHSQSGGLFLIRIPYRNRTKVKRSFIPRNLHSSILFEARRA